MNRAIVFGGYGVFGGHVARGLSERGIPVTIAGRDAAKAISAAKSLKEGQGLAANANDLASCRAALAGHAVAVNCAGPFSTLGPALPDACLAAGVHYVDIADDRAWFAHLKARDAEFRARDLLCVPGASSLPAISLALATIARANCPAAPHVARVTLFVGNDNPKGEAAIRSAAAIAGRPIQAPQGPLRGFSLAEIIDLPAPFGRRAARNFESADYDLFPALFGIREIRVKVGFESRPGNALFGALGRLPAGATRLLAPALIALGRVIPRFGHSGGVIMTELFGKGFRCSAALSCLENGQQMAALPAVFAAQQILEGAPARGVLTASELLGGEALVARLLAAGPFTLTRQ